MSWHQVQQQQIRQQVRVTVNDTEHKARPDNSEAAAYHTQVPVDFHQAEASQFLTTECISPSGNEAAWCIANCAIGCWTWQGQRGLHHTGGHVLCTIAPIYLSAHSNLACLQDFVHGETLVQETPLVAGQHSTNKKHALVCSQCFRFLGSIKLQLAWLRLCAMCDGMPNLRNLCFHMTSGT